MSNQELIPDFTLDDFLQSAEPYEWLYQFKDNKFKLTQLVEQMKIIANKKGFKRFISTWNEFVKQEAAKAKIALENVTEFEDQDEELFTGKWTCNDYGVFSFDKNEEISTHASGGDAMVTVLDGKGKFTISGKEYFLEEGQSIVMPKDEPHSVFGEEKFKMLLVVSF